MKCILKTTILATAAVSLMVSATSAERVRLKIGATFPSKLTQLGTLGKKLESKCCGHFGW